MLTGSMGTYFIREDGVDDAEVANVRERLGSWPEVTGRACRVRIRPSRGAPMPA